MCVLYIQSVCVFVSTWLHAYVCFQCFSRSQSVCVSVIFPVRRVLLLVLADSPCVQYKFLQHSGNNMGLLCVVPVDPVACGKNVVQVVGVWEVPKGRAICLGWQVFD